MADSTMALALPIPAGRRKQEIGVLQWLRQLRWQWLIGAEIEKRIIAKKEEHLLLFALRRDLLW